VLAGEVLHGVVWEGPEEVVEAADHRQLPWPRWWVLTGIAAPQLDDKETSYHYEDGGQDNGVIEVVVVHHFFI
jgi:hypothetical protein